MIGKREVYRKRAPSGSRYHTSWPGFGGCPNYLPEDYKAEDENMDEVKIAEQLERHFNENKQAYNTIDLVKVGEFVELLESARDNGHTIFVMGNGGSESLATHFAADLSKNTKCGCECRVGACRPWFKVISLSGNPAAITAYANDEGYEYVYQRQLENLVQSKDVVILISGSGTSGNIVKVAEYMNTLPLAKTISLTGFNGGDIADMVNVNIHVDSGCYEVIEDCHGAVLHAVVRYFKGNL